jgi:hypothetical protein
MTNEEAYKWIYVHFAPCGDETKQDEAISIAFNAIAKQIPKKPKRVGYFLMCPICYGRNGLFDYDYVVTKQIGRDENISHCLVCGQAIDWTDNE